MALALQVTNLGSIPGTLNVPQVSPKAITEFKNQIRKKDKTSNMVVCYQGEYE